MPTELARLILMLRDRRPPPEMVDRMAATLVYRGSSNEAMIAADLVAAMTDDARAGRPWLLPALANGGTRPLPLPNEMTRREQSIRAWPSLEHGLGAVLTSAGRARALSADFLRGLLYANRLR